LGATPFPGGLGWAYTGMGKSPYGMTLTSGMSVHSRQMVWRRMSESGTFRKSRSAWKRSAYRLERTCSAGAQKSVNDPDVMRRRAQAIGGSSQIVVGADAVRAAASVTKTRSKREEPPCKSIAVSSPFLCLRLAS
jgi:hypothetical protein